MTGRFPLVGQSGVTGVLCENSRSVTNECLHVQNFRVEIDMPPFPSLLNLDKVHVTAFPISSFFSLRQHDVERTWALKSDVSASRSRSPFISRMTLES